MSAAHCHQCPGVKLAAGAKKLVLAGNPNVGKSVIFHALTGIYVDVSNFPGTTVDISSGHLGEDGVFDTPGVYGISAFNEEERVARDMIVQADTLINVVDAAHLDRDLFLTLQIIEMGFPTLVVLNMMDEAASHGLKIDLARLSEELGVEVIPAVAVKQQGIGQIKEAIYRARPGKLSAYMAGRLPSGLSQADGVLVAEGDPDTCARHGLTPAGAREEIYRLRRQRADEIAAAVVSETNSGASLATRIGRWTLDPWRGAAILALFLVAMYYLLGVGVAQWVVGITEEQWMGELYIPWITELGSRFVSPESFFGEMLIGEFGLLTMTVSYLLGLLLPLVVGFYLVLSFMEDTGYLPRVAVLVDRAMIKIGLNGRAIIPMILGFGCVTMATITTRLMGTQRERTIATFLLSLAIPCSAQLAVIAAMLAPLGGLYALFFAAILFVIYGLAGMALNRVLPGQSSDLLIDLPPLRMPRVTNILHKTYLKSKSFLAEAGLFFAGGSVVVSALYAWGVLDRLQAALAPVTESWMGLPRETATAFIMGFVRRDFGAAGLFDLELTPQQTIVSLLTITLFVPCIAAIMIMLKERGKKEAAVIWVADLALALFVGGLVSKLIFW